MTKPVESILNCPCCQAKVWHTAKACWKCGAELTGSSAASDQPSSFPVAEYAGTTEPTRTRSSTSTFKLASLLLITTLIAVCMALFVAAPGLGICLAILSLPALIRTTMVTQLRRTRGMAVDSGSKVGLFLSSLGTTFVILTVTWFACGLAFFASCLAVYAVTSVPGNNRSEALILPISSVFTIAVAILMLWMFGRWVGYRWRRDTNLPEDLERVVR